MVHEKAALGYDRAATPYNRSRPSYPDAAIRLLLTELDLDAGKHVVEFGAGTGIFTRQLVAHGLRVTAVEPVAAMREKLAALAEVAVSPGTAEASELADGVADAVIAATAWHWFDAERALREVTRLLHAGEGGLGLVWNQYDETVPWVAEFVPIASRRRAADQPSERSGEWRAFFDRLPGWTALESAEFTNPWTTSPDGVVSRLMSSSAIAARPEPDRARARDEALKVLERHGLADEQTIVLPYRTYVYWTRPTRDR